MISPSRPAEFRCIREFSMKSLHFITLILVILGALNWGLMGLFQLDLVATIFGGPQTALSRIVYILVGLSGLYQIVPLLSAVSGHSDNPQLATGGRH
jgi:uncharacterized membrane protein YuzA (DUF378 family)